MDEPLNTASPVTQIIAIFGSIRKVASAIGINHTVVARWEKRGGAVPPAWSARLIAAAEAISPKAADRVASLVPKNVCPCCGQGLAVGVPPISEENIRKAFCR